MRMMTPGLARSVTPSDWTTEQLARREHTPRQLHLPRIPRPQVPEVPQPPRVRVSGHRTP
ncbi:hypothetical protein [Phycicoccus sonneratiae]|uniref:Uncharacterized protein n=1 Tax=Phycicoccus sonneratiae TaxID=2807628 RepID=A0ABS2CLY0_9MICO|nr:hypothetical protein [Phycicoccus sonneraticus]MBM6400780.1 hypothetical protein [Phycicoccus sonneraticus]